jgi:hypothetical protein
MSIKIHVKPLFWYLSASSINPKSWKLRAVEKNN